MVNIEKTKLSVLQLYAEPLHEVAEYYDMYDNMHRAAAFIAQTAHESGGFNFVKENLNYSAKGLMGTFKKYFPTEELAKQYGTVKFVVNAIPKKAKVFNSLNEWEIFFYNTLIRNYCKEHGLKETRTNFSQNTTIEDEMQKLGFDGIIIKGREMVNYKPENVLYFGNENQLKFYYEDIT